MLRRRYMLNIEEHKNKKYKEALNKKHDAMEAAGYRDPDGTTIVNQETWDILLQTGSTEGFRLETEIDRKRQDRRIAEGPTLWGRILDGYEAQKRYETEKGLHKNV